MTNVKHWTSGIALAATLFGGLNGASAAINILGNRYDNNRTAANLTETTLTPTTVSSSTFGKIGSYSVDGAIFAQPLYVQGALTTGQMVAKNVLYVATMHDVVYAFDADNPGSAPLWTHDYRGTGITPGTPFDTVTASDGMGIVGTPVIDLASNRMYLVAETMEAGAYVQRIHALDIRSGAELATTVIAGSSKGGPSIRINIPSGPAWRYRGGRCGSPSDRPFRAISNPGTDG